MDIRQNPLRVQTVYTGATTIIDATTCVGGGPLGGGYEERSIIECANDHPMRIRRPNELTSRVVKACEVWSGDLI